MVLKIDALEKYSTWEVVTLPNGTKPVGCNWVYTIKYKADESIERYKTSFIDGCTRITWLYFLKHKYDINPVIPIFHSMIQNQFGVNIKRFRTNNARDYFNQVVFTYSQSKGIIHNSSCVYIPQQNGMTEEK